MTERKRSVLYANILIRACLGIRVRQLIADSASKVDFILAEANAAEASGYIDVLAVISTFSKSDSRRSSLHTFSNPCGLKVVLHLRPLLIASACD